MKLLLGLIVLLFVLSALGISAQAQDFTFIVLGDTGSGKIEQYQVSKAIQNVCYNEKCKFAILLGDNFYYEGVTSVNDPQFKEKFEDPYANLDFPFYITLGNHDYGKYANDWKRGDYQIQYGLKNPKWILPSQYYTWDFLNVRFIALDTSRLFWNKDVKKQEQFVEPLLSTDQWKIVVAHHPYLSNGEHGNAGKYDGVTISPFSGDKIKKFIEKKLCPKIDLYMNGHDHNLQVLKPTDKCPNPFVVSGAGAKVDPELKTNRNPFYFQKATLGFHLVRVSQNEMEIVTINSESRIEHILTLRK